MESLGPIQLLERLQKASQSLSTLLSPMERDNLLVKILVGAKKVAHADAGTLYLVENNHLMFQLLLNDTLNITEASDNPLKTQLKSIPLKDVNGRPNLNTVATATVNTKKSVNISDAYSTTKFDF